VRAWVRVDATADVVLLILKNACVSACVCVFAFVCDSVSLCVCVSVSVSVSISVCVCVCVCVCVWVCVCVCMSVFVFVSVRIDATADVVLSILKNGMNERFAGSAAGTAFGDVCASLLLIHFPLIFLVLIIALQLLPLMLLVELGCLRCLLIRIWFSL